VLGDAIRILKTVVYVKKAQKNKQQTSFR